MQYMDKSSVKPLVLMGPAYVLRVHTAQEGGCLPGTKHLVTRLTGKSPLSAAGSHGNIPGSIILSELNLRLKLWAPQRGNSALTACPRRQARSVCVIAALRMSYEKSDVTHSLPGKLCLWTRCASRVKSATESKTWKPHNLSLGFRGITKKCMQRNVCKTQSSHLFNILAYNTKVSLSVRIIQ